MAGRLTCCQPVTTPVACDNNLVGQMNLMCLLPRAHVAIGLIDPGSGVIADEALARIAAYGYPAVALWPDNDPFLGCYGDPFAHTPGVVSDCHTVHDAAQRFT